MGEWPDLLALHARADQPPAAPREPLFVATSALDVGSVEPALARRMAAAGLPIAPVSRGWCVGGPRLHDSFEQIATWLHEQGLGSAWRDELLSVRDASGAAVALIERAAVRPLGIVTHAVHLVGWAEQGGVWVQQRALDKATDPGLWDTLMGGLISADESIADTLARETWEEAGLRVADLRELGAQGTITVRRPVSDGYMVEDIHVFEAVVPAGHAPSNQDGEVAAFECLSVADLHNRLRAGAFTLEAALILVGVLGRRLPG